MPGRIYSNVLHSSKNYETSSSWSGLAYEIGVIRLASRPRCDEGMRSALWVRCFSAPAADLAHALTCVWCSEACPRCSGSGRGFVWWCSRSSSRYTRCLRRKKQEKWPIPHYSKAGIFVNVASFIEHWTISWQWRSLYVYENTSGSKL